jgi:hypothetical protein
VPTVHLQSLLPAARASAAIQLASSSRLLQQAQNTTQDATDTTSPDADWAAAAVMKSAQTNLWIAVIPQLPTDADIELPDGWHSSVKPEGNNGEFWSWNVSHSSVPGDKASAVMCNWCDTVRPLTCGADNEIPNFDLFAVIGECCCGCRTADVCCSLRRGMHLESSTMQRLSQQLALDSQVPPLPGRWPVVTN